MNPAANNADPQPANTSQNVPISSATNFFVTSISEAFQKGMASNREGKIKSAGPGENPNDCNANKFVERPKFNRD
jgi:hypothetical protein